MAKNRVLRVGAAGAGAAAVLALTGSAAFAGPPSIVSVAGSTTSTSYNYKATSTGTTLTVGSFTVNCILVVLHGSLNGGSIGWGASTPLATVATSAWTGCTSPGPVNMAATIGDLLITGDTVADVTPVTSTFAAEVTDTNFGGLLCDLFITGSVSGHIDYIGQDLTFDTSTLTADVDPNNTGADCSGLVQDNGSAALNGAFHLTDTGGAIFPIRITS